MARRGRRGTSESSVGSVLTDNAWHIRWEQNLKMKRHFGNFIVEQPDSSEKVPFIIPEERSKRLGEDTS